MIGVVNYGVGNIGSLCNALEYLGIPYLFSRDLRKLNQCDRLILPGVGAFSPAMDALVALGLDIFLQKWAEKDRPLFGICLGMQLLFTESEEDGLSKGLNIIPGYVKRFQNAPRSIHIGWNKVIPRKSNQLIRNIGYAYFVHSYFCKPENQDHIIAESNYGDLFTAIVQVGNVFGVQFHPEKSQSFGLQILRRFNDGII
jgi:glutamine amidotransferase